MLKEWTYPLVRCASISRVIRSADGICGNQLLSLSSNESLPRSTNCISTVVSIAVVMLPVMVVHVRRGGHAGHRLPERTGHHRVAVAPDAHDRRAHLVPLNEARTRAAAPVCGRVRSQAQPIWRCVAFKSASTVPVTCSDAHGGRFKGSMQRESDRTVSVLEWRSQGFYAGVR